MMNFFRRLFGSGKSGSEKPAAEKMPDFRPLMTSQLAAFLLNTGDERYREEYFRRIRMCGVSDDTAKQWLDFETEILTRCPRPEMCREDFVRMPLLTLDKKFLPESISYYADHFDYPLSYVIRISDEAEWHYWHSHERDLPDGVWAEIFELADRNRKLFLPLAQYMVEHLGWTVAAVNKYSYHEQGMLDILRWKNGAKSSSQTPWEMTLR